MEAVEVPEEVAEVQEEAAEMQPPAQAAEEPAEPAVVETEVPEEVLTPVEVVVEELDEPEPVAREFADTGPEEVAEEQPVAVPAEVTSEPDIIDAALEELNRLGSSAYAFEPAAEEPAGEDAPETLELHADAAGDGAAGELYEDIPPFVPSSQTALMTTRRPKSALVANLKQAAGKTGAGLGTLGKNALMLSQKTGRSIGRQVSNIMGKFRLKILDLKQEQGIDRWDAVAGSFAGKVALLAEETPELKTSHIFVQEQNRTAFEKSYHDLITSQLIQKGMLVSPVKEGSPLALVYQAKVLQDKVFITTSLKDDQRILVQHSDVSDVKKMDDWRYYVEDLLMDPATQRTYKRYKMVDR
ncbi:hypothetical protein ACFL43_05115 [Thermodesulfobacteriota bacterium]